MIDPETRETFLDAAHRVARQGLLRCSSGNLSCRVGDDLVLISASRSWLGDLRNDQLVTLRLSDGEVVDGPRPSVEKRFHLGIYRSRPDVNVVLHYQSTAATAITCMDPRDVEFNVIPEVPYYIGPIGVVPYIPPGSEPLALAVIDCMKTHDLALLRNHGQVTVGRDFAHAIQNAEFFELACEVILRAGDRLHPIPPDAARALVESGRSDTGEYVAG